MLETQGRHISFPSFFQRGLVASLAIVLSLLIGMRIGAVGWAPPAVLGSPVVAAPAQAALDPQSTMAVARSVGPAVVSVRTDRGLGSGVIYDASGLILTNAHVVEGARSVTIALSDGRRLPATVKGRDAGFDLAVLQVEAQGLPVARLGDSSTLEVGEPVVAIGNPYGLDRTVTTGVVSAVNRPVSEGDRSYSQPMIQTDAAINPGNSGGPLLDLEGTVVGINTLVAAPQGFPAQGLGFAVPASTAKRIAPQLAQQGRVVNSGQPYLGIGIGEQPSGASAAAGPRRPSVPSAPAVGVLISRIEAGGAAAQAGLRVGDRIVTFDGREVYGGDDFLQNLVIHQPGDQVTLDVERDGQRLSLKVTLGEAPARQQA